MANIDLYKGSFEKISELKASLESVANKNKLSPESLILLLALNCGVDLSFLVKAEFVDELIRTGFSERKDNRISITGKGAIFAKSLERILWNLKVIVNKFIILTMPLDFSWLLV